MTRSVRTRPPSWRDASAATGCSPSTPDIIFRIALRPTAATEYLSLAVERVLGYPPSAFDDD
jgi:hypothetical protein